MNEIQELLKRGVANIIPGSRELEQRLNSGEKLNIYLGIDPTAIRIHLGHAVSLRKLQKLSDLGHNVTFLVGDFTARIGDTSDKEGERPQLTDAQIKENLKTYRDQASKLIDFEKVKIRFNSEWLEKLSFEELIGLVGKFTLNDFISRELIKKRLNAGKSVGLLETIYPIMQGYDSYILDTDLQIGGTDQTFNMQSGRALLRSKKESFIMAMEFLPGTDGRKMSKTWENAIWLTDGPEEVFGKIMSLSDKFIYDYFVLSTNIPLDEIDAFKKEIETDPMKMKKKLADAIVSEIYSKDQARSAQSRFEKTVQNKEVPSKVREIETKLNKPLLDFLVENGLVESKSEGKRLIEQGGVTVGNEKASLNSFIEKTSIIKTGKRNYVKAVTTE